MKADYLCKEENRISKTFDYVTHQFLADLQ